MKRSWFEDAVIYHLFPLGALGCPPTNDGTAAPADRLSALDGWLDRAIDLGATTVQLGPVFESSGHGYDTIDLFHVDRRLGTDDDLARWTERARKRGVRVMFDAVLNHVGRRFWAFREVLADPTGSRFRDWFHIRANERSPFGDPFGYEGWAGHHELVKLNHAHPEVRGHLFEAIRSWVERFGIDGLRVDAADAIDGDFLSALASQARELREDFITVGEMVHGDYRRIACPTRLDSATNYEVYKGLYSSFNDANLFEIAYSLNRLFAPGGLYEGAPMLNFAENHDVERVASRLAVRAHLYPLHILLFTIPGVPAVYYGEERGVIGRKIPNTDAPLRPALDPAGEWGVEPGLESVVRRLIALRRTTPALRRGSYRQLHVASRQFAFLRRTADEPRETIVVAVNAESRPATIDLTLPDGERGILVDTLDDGRSFSARDGRATINLDSNWGRVLRLEPI